MTELYILGGFGLAGLAFLVWMGSHATKAGREARFRTRQAMLMLAEHERQAEADRLRHLNWLHAQAYRRPKLTVVDGGRSGECAVIPFRKPERD